MSSFRNVIGFIMILSGVLVFGFQVFIWLRNGGWVSFPLLILLSIIPNDFLSQSWLNSPQSWYGLHKLIIGALEIMPLSLFLFVIGALLLPGFSYKIGGVTQKNQEVRDGLSEDNNSNEASE